jgi:hypothetical protein
MTIREPLRFWLPELSSAQITAVREYGSRMAREAREDIESRMVRDTPAYDTLNAKILETLNAWGFQNYTRHCEVSELKHGKGHIIEHWDNGHVADLLAEELAGGVK